MFIYKISNLINGKIYIGQSTQKTLHRLQEHKSKLRAGTHENSHLQRAWTLYGEDKFVIEVIHTCKTIEELNSLEEKYVEELQSRNPSYGYNIRGAGNNRTHSEETKRKISAAKKGISVHTASSRRKIARFARNKVHSTESKQKRSIKLTGHVWPEELINRWALAQRKGIPYPLLIDPTGIEHTVTNMTSFAKAHSLKQQKLSELVRGKKKSYKGWTIKPLEIK